jgi:flagellin
MSSILARNALVSNERNMSTSMERLSTGLRINSAKDDAAGLAISSKMTSQIRGLDQAVRNANDAVSLIQTAEGALIETTNMLQRMRELAVQSASDTNVLADRAALDLEFQALKAEIDRIGDNTQWNGTNILDKSFDGAAANDGKFTFQVGANGAAGETISLTILDYNTSATAALEDVENLDVTDRAKSTASITALDAAIAVVNTGRAEMGATMNRLQYAADNLANVSANATESRGRILDADYAKETTELARTQIIAQAGTAMLAQANQVKQTVLSLLK